VRTIKLALSAFLLAFSSWAWAGAIDVNSADAKTLESLDGIGPAKAQAIVTYREKNGPFKNVDELEKVSGIGKATVEKNREKISTGSGKTTAAKSDKSKAKKTE
jgi:competence protein ComEA